MMRDRVLDGRVGDAAHAYSIPPEILRLEVAKNNIRRAGDIETNRIARRLGLQGESVYDGPTRGPWRDPVISVNDKVHHFAGVCHVDDRMPRGAAARHRCRSQ